MSQALEATLPRLGVDLQRVQGWVNVPAETVIPLQAIHLHAARPMGINQPTPEAVQGTLEILRLVDRAGPHDLLLCLISGGGSALLCAPVPGITLAEKQVVTKLLSQCGATIAQMNTVRKHLSLIKGGGLVSRFFHHRIEQRRLLSLIISDVIGDPLDVIASGPTCVDPTTYYDTLRVLDRFKLRQKVPTAVLRHLERGAAGSEVETLKIEPTADNQKVVYNQIIASNPHALYAAEQVAKQMGYAITNLGDRIDGETQTFARTLSEMVESQLANQAQPRCILSGGETTVTLSENPGKGGRNQELALGFLVHVSPTTLQRTTLLCGGTDGEDGPTDAAGAFADREVLRLAREKGLPAQDYLRRHDAYTFFAATEGLFKTGLTNTNVMDLRVLLLF